MPFQFKRKEAVRKGIRRVATERIEAALECLKDYREADAIHGVRKDIKKVRAVLGLARAHIAKKIYRRQKETLRGAADELAATRDAYVKAAALHQLSDHLNGGVPPKALKQLRKALAGDLAKAEERFARKKRTVKVRRALRKIQTTLDSIELNAKGWKAIRSGVKTSYTCGQRAYQQALQEPSPEHLHEWRKRVKELWYQLCLLEPIRPKELKRMASDFKDLSEFLGDDHDLFLLRQTLENNGEFTHNVPDALSITGMVEQRQRELRTKALASGVRLYAEKPADFCARLAQYWHQWRSGKERRANCRTTAARSSSRR